MSLRVLYSFPHRLGTPGIGSTAWHQVQGLADLGLRVTVFCGSIERQLRGVERVIETMRLGPVSLPYRVLGLDRAMAWHDRTVAASLCRREEEFDLLHCWPSGSLRTLRAAVQMGLPSFLERPSSHTQQVYEVVAQECAALGMEMPPAHYGFWNNRRLEREEAEFGLADLLLCPSESAARTFLDRGYDVSQLAIHQYGYDPAEFAMAPVHASAQTRRPFTVAFVGECSPLKALHVALRAWLDSGAADSGRFLVCGRFVAGYREALAGLLKHHSVECMGFVSDVGAVMRGADALVHSSLSEGSALVCYEAQASGLILLVSDAAGARCAHGVDSMIHRAGDVATLAAHLREVSTNPALALRLRSATAVRAQKLTWSHAAVHLRTIYTDQRSDAAPCCTASPALGPSYA